MDWVLLIAGLAVVGIAAWIFWKLGNKEQPPEPLTPDN
jgi:hypothetical protein